MFCTLIDGETLIAAAATAADNDGGRRQRRRPPAHVASKQWRRFAQTAERIFGRHRRRYELTINLV